MFDIKDYICREFSATNIVISEVWNNICFKFEVNHLIKFIKIKNLFDKISNRDNMSFKINDISDNVCIITSANSNDSLLLDKINKDYEEDDNLKIEISIDKNINDNRVSIYCWDNFVSKLLNYSTIDFLNTISFYINERDYICFEVFDKDICWNTGTLFFVNNSSFVPKDFVDRQNKIVNSKDICNFSNQLNFSLLPDDFNIKNDYDGNPLSELFSKYETIFSIIYISNTSILENEILKSIIIGQKMLNYELKIDEIVSNDILNRIYFWVYSDDNIIDKAMIARNIITLHCKFSKLLDLDDKTYSSILSNYQVYLKNNVNKFLDAKENVSNFINEISLSVSQNIFSLANDFKQNIVAIFGFLLTYVVGNIITGSNFNKMISPEIVIIIDIILMGSIIFFIISLFAVLYKYRRNEIAYLNLKNNYADIFSENDFNIIFKDNMFEESQCSFINGVIFYSIIWMLFVFLMLILFNYVLL